MGPQGRLGVLTPPLDILPSLESLERGLIPPSSWGRALLPALLCQWAPLMVFPVSLWNSELPKQEFAPRGWDVITGPSELFLGQNVRHSCFKRDQKKKKKRASLWRNDHSGKTAVSVAGWWGRCLETQGQLHTPKVILHGGLGSSLYYSVLSQSSKINMFSFRIRKKANKDSLPPSWPASISPLYSHPQGRSGTV